MFSCPAVGLNIAARRGEPPRPRSRPRPRGSGRERREGGGSGGGEAEGLPVAFPSRRPGTVTRPPACAEGLSPPLAPASRNAEPAGPRRHSLLAPARLPGPDPSPGPVAASAVQGRKDRLSRRRLLRAKWRLHAQVGRLQRLRGLWAGPQPRQGAGPGTGKAEAPGSGLWAWPAEGKERHLPAWPERLEQASARGREMGGAVPRCQRRC